MASFGFGEMFTNVSRSVLNSALTAAQNTANRVLDPFAVQEISTKANLDEVAVYPVLRRAAPLLLYGPVPPGRFVKTAAYHIIIHAPHNKMFSLLRTDQITEAEDTFKLFKETFNLLVDCDPLLLEVSKLDSISKKQRENKGWTAPHVAAAVGLLNCLRNPKMKPKLNDQEGGLLRTPLMVAIDQGNVAVVSTLLDLGVDVSIKDIKDNTIFHLAATGSPQIFQLLSEKVTLKDQELLSHVNAEGFTPLHSACSSNNSVLVKALLNAGAKSVKTELHGLPIHCATKAQSATCIQELVSRDPSQLLVPDLQDSGSPLHWAAGPETLIPLLDLGCDPNAIDGNGLTPLHAAARRGCVKSTLYLLCHGAFPNIKGGEMDDTPLHVAARLCSGIIIKILIVFGADINLTNGNEFTPRHLVCTSQRSDKDAILFILSAAGAKRCLQKDKSVCVDGCSFFGRSDGIPPSNFPNNGLVNLMDQALNGVKRSSDQGRSNEMEVEADNTDDPNRNVGGGGRILCLDGGGVRGVVLTQMLVVIEETLGSPVIDLFDFVAGTSTGGILALCLASKKSPLQAQCVYMRLKDKVFVGERPYSASVMEEFLKTEFGSETIMGTITRPKVMIMSAIVDQRPVDLHIFRNYLSPAALIGHPEPCEQEHATQFVWEVAKVTGAAPSYFRLDHSKFIDGGIISNNPTLDALTELQRLKAALNYNGLKGSQKIPSVVVSLGTGIPPKTGSNVSLLDITWPSGVFDAITSVPRLASLVNLLIDQATQSEGRVVERAKAWCSSIEVPFYRFSPQMMEDVKLDEKDDEKLVDLLWETRCYMVANQYFISEMLRTLVENSPEKSQKSV